MRKDETMATTETEDQEKKKKELSKYATTMHNADAERIMSTIVRTHWQCWFCVSTAFVVRSVILRFFSHGVLFVKFLCAPVFVCLKGP